MNVYERAVLYHFVHALGILIVAALAAAGAISRRAENWTGGLLLAGIVLFSGSLYIAGAQRQSHAGRGNDAVRWRRFYSRLGSAGD